MVVVGDTQMRLSALFLGLAKCAAHTATIEPLWPLSKPYEMTCPPLTPAHTCRLLSRPLEVCFEPEQETAEVVNALLAGGCRDDAACLYVDIGCNVGLFATQAAALGASVECIEPAPFYVQAARATAALNRFARLNVTHAAVLPNGADELHTGRSRAPPLRFTKTYFPCGIGSEDGAHLHEWTARPLSIRQLLRGRHVTLLKIDIDSIEGALLHTAVEMLEAKSTSVHSLLVELGDESAGFAWCDHPDLIATEMCTERADLLHPEAALTPRGGSLRDLQRLQRLGFHIFRLNIHVAREIFDWRGDDANRRHVPLAQSYVPIRNVRGIRLLHWLPPSAQPWENHSEYRRLLQESQTILATRENLFTVASKHGADLHMAGIARDRSPEGQAAAIAALNRDNPLYKGTRCFSRRSHDECGARSWCDDMGKCRRCEDWDPHDATASITYSLDAGKLPPACVEVRSRFTPWPNRL